MKEEIYINTEDVNRQRQIRREDKIILEIWVTWKKMCGYEQETLNIITRAINRLNHLEPSGHYMYHPL
jgi:hypothetical protein